MPSLVWFLLLLAALQGRGAPPSGSRADRGSITGTVKRADAAVDNQRLPNMQIELRPAGLFANTSGGNFSFRDVAPGRYQLIPHTEGFVIQEDPAKGVTSLGITVAVAPGQTVANITLPMIAAPAIFGYAFHPNGERLAAGVVEAYARRYTPYGRQLKIVKKTLTNDFGEYRLFWLNFGEYVVTANYSDRALRSALGGVRLSPNVTKPDDGYATMFYERAMNPADAKSVHLAPGSDSANTNIFLSDIPRFRINGRIVSSTSIPPDLSLTFAPAGSDLSVNRDYSVAISGDGRFVINAVSPGSYVLLASGSEMSSELVPVSVANNDVANVSLRLFPTMTLTGRISVQGFAGNLANMLVTLVRTSSEVDQKFEGLTSADGSFTISSIPRGEFDVVVDRIPPNTYARNIRFFGQGPDVLFAKMQVATLDTNSRLDVVLGSALATVEGTVTDSKGKPAAGAQVVLVPEARLRHRTDRYIVGFTDGSGSFQLKSIPPGKYTAYAFEHIEPGAYYAFAYDPRVNALFGNRGEPVTIDETGVTTLQLKVIAASETAGGFQ